MPSDQAADPRIPASQVSLPWTSHVRRALGTILSAIDSLVLSRVLGFRGEWIRFLAGFQGFGGNGFL